jgi:propionate CoA-transferase
VTYSGAFARRKGQPVFYITERCVLRLADDGLELVEIAPGIELERDVLDHMAFRPRVADDLELMDEAIFREPRMGLRDRSPLSLEERLSYDADHDRMYVNFEGLRLLTEDDVEELARFLDERFAALGKKVNVVVNYDNFEFGPAAEPRFLEMVRHNDSRYFLSSTRYSTNAFFRRQLSERFEAAKLAEHVYRSFEGGDGEPARPSRG